MNALILGLVLGFALGMVFQTVRDDLDLWWRGR